jgi:hypothetical protein
MIIIQLLIPWGKGVIMKQKGMYSFLLVLLSVVVIIGCGSSGGGGGGNGGTSATSIKSSGLMTKGSVILNGVTYTIAANATIRIDDNPGTEGGLDDGMVVKLSGTKNDDGVTGTADAIEEEHEFKGVVTDVNTLADPQNIEILDSNLTVYVDDLTVYSNVADLSGISPSDFIEVHGFRDVDGNIRATRVELLSGPLVEDEIKGIVTNLNVPILQAFSIGALQVNFGLATIEPAGATLANGQLVEVHGNMFLGAFDATLVQIEDLEDDEFDHPGTFKVDGRSVQTTSATEFVGGSSEDLMNEIRVEAEGHNSGNVLIAEKIKFKRARVRMVAVASSASTLDFATGDTVTIVINDLTDTSNATLPLAGPQRYEMEGFKDNAGNIIAEEIEDTNESRDILKAPVEAKAGDILTMISLSIDISNVPADEFKDENDNQITKAEFLSGATVGTVVKVRDNDPDGLWDRAELED